MNHLGHNALLQEGRYKIIRTLGQGGFGITYLALQNDTGCKVAIKEFFMKEFCVRDEETGHVSLGTDGGRETVARFREKFLKEAHNLTKFNHPNIVRILNIFEENGTAYYVMEYADAGSLSDLVKRRGYLPEYEATQYVLQIANALEHVHRHRMTHLDVKPSNIMLNSNGQAILIDFGLSKQYNNTGNQTSTTPVGISEGYAPMEQYKQGGVQDFSPETDVYALAATFFKLLTGNTPPSASDINEDGVPIQELRTRGVSENTIGVICMAMKSRKRERPRSMNAFTAYLTGTSPTAQYYNSNYSSAPYANQQESPNEWFNATNIAWACIIAGSIAIIAMLVALAIEDS